MHFKCLPKALPHKFLNKWYVSKWYVLTTLCSRKLAVSQFRGTLTWTVQRSAVEAKSRKDTEKVVAKRHTAKQGCLPALVFPLRKWATRGFPSNPARRSAKKQLQQLAANQVQTLALGLSIEIATYVQHSIWVMTWRLLTLPTIVFRCFHLPIPCFPQSDDVKLFGSCCICCGSVGTCAE